MYARVTTTRVQPGKLAGALAIWQEAVLPAARRQPGFRGVLVLADRHTHRSVALTLWATEADLRASVASGYVSDALAKFTGVFAGPPAQRAYAVAFHTPTLLARGGASRYAAVATIPLQPGPGRADEALDLWRRGALAQAAQVPGFHDLLLLLDREEDALLSLGLYATFSAVQAVETSGRFQQVTALLTDLYAGQPTREVYEVLLEATGAPEAPASG